MKKVIEEIGNLKNSNFDAKDGGFNVLNMPDNYYAANPDKFWDDYNKPFLDEAIKRGDDIVLATNPLKVEKVFRKIEDIPKIDNVKDLSSYLNKLELEDLTGFGKELKYLFENGYFYDITKNIFTK